MARDFNGTTDRIDWANVQDMADTALTISMWVYFDNYASGLDEYLLCSHESGDANVGWIFWKTSTDRLRISRFDVTGWDNLYSDRGDTGVPSNGVWTHLITTDDGAGNGEVYVNNATPSSSGSGTTSGTPNDSAGSWSIGGRIYDDNRNFNGKIAEVGVWNRVISSSERSILYDDKMSPLYFPNGLLFYSPLYGSNTDVDYLNGVASTTDGTSKFAHAPIVNVS